MRVLERSASVGPRWRRLKWMLLTSLAVTGMAIVATACGGSDNSDSTSSKAATAKKSGPASGPLTVWVDSVRQPVAKAYAKAHPDVDLKIVTFDGDANGATTLQTKIQLWNRTGKGWPDAREFVGRLAHAWLGI